MKTKQRIKRVKHGLSPTTILRSALIGNWHVSPESAARLYLIWSNQCSSTHDNQSSSA